MLVLLALLCAGCGRDNSDPPGGRSGMKVKIDNLTGCEYLRTYEGGLTPRLDADGKQICRQGAKP